MQLGTSSFKLPHVTLLPKYTKLMCVSFNLGCREVEGLVVVARENEGWVLLQYFLRWEKQMPRYYDIAHTCK